VSNEQTRLQVPLKLFGVDSWILTAVVVVNFCGQPHYYNWPYYTASRFSPAASWYMVLIESLLDRSRYVSCQINYLCRDGSSMRLVRLKPQGPGPN